MTDFLVVQPYWFWFTILPDYKSCCFFLCGSRFITINSLPHSHILHNCNSWIKIRSLWSFNPGVLFLVPNLKLH